jgi:glycerol-3-phosphate dehydrogenase
MNRKDMLQKLAQTSEWDIIIIGGGATGVGIAVDAASRGFKTLLLEQHDFGKGTSSRATKLVHGGVRYLAQGNIKLVKHALKERGLLLKNAPHVTTNISFVLPCYSLWQKIFYGVGLTVYDLLAGRLGLGKTAIIGTQKTKTCLPTISTKKLAGAIVYKDGQFDDARLLINLAQTAAEQGAVLLNYCKITSLVKNENKVVGVIASDVFTGNQFTIKGKVVVNATGVFTDEVLKLDNASAPGIVTPAQGIHLVIDKKFFPGTQALMIPKTADGRVLFAVPWHQQVVVGTTDTPVKNHSLEPRALPEEIEFILSHLNKYLDINITRADVKSIFAGLRPLVKRGTGNNTSIIPRDHTIILSSSGLISITGGKWTTYRKMAIDVMDKIFKAGFLPQKECVTEQLKIHGWVAEVNITNELAFYGSDASGIQQIVQEQANYAQKIHPSFPYLQAQVIWAVRHEMALTVEDMLARRIRLLFLDARAAMEAAPTVAKLMAAALNKNDDWQQQQINDFTALAKQYVLS